jgi:hypothetical protein
MLAMAGLVLLPALVFGIPAMLGHSVLPGDDLTQNFPLRVLAGHQISAGHLPLFDPYIWSGAPLLAGWNAGAAYPFTLLFAILPGVGAWTLNLIAAWVTAGLGMFWFLRALRLRSLASFLGALSFAFAGAMPAQVGHFGLVAGMSWVPVELLAVLRLTEERDRASRVRWVCVLAVAFGLTILAGEPRAIANACVVVFIYAGWRIARSGRGFAPALISVAAGLALGVCLGAVQLLPGLVAVGTSQRSATSMALYSSGSLAPRWLLLALVPDLLGGSGSFGQPSFLATYNLAEVTSYVGIFPLVAAAALLGRLRPRSRPPEWLVWHVIALAGVVCALGAKTPIGHVLVHLPLFGDQRLQSRNIAVLDLALAILLGYWADDPFGTRSPARAPDSRRRVALQTGLGLLAPLAAIGVVAAGVVSPRGLIGWLGVSPGAAAAAGRVVPELVPYALLGAAAAGFVIFGRRLSQGLWSRLLAGLVAIDLIVFTLLAVVAVGAGQGATAVTPAGHAAAAPAGQARTRAARTTPSPPARPIAALGYPGRSAIYDPDLLDEGELTVLGAPDLNVMSATPSIQGYSSIVDGQYAAATGSHHLTGDGQDVLAPSAISNGTLAQLDTSVLLTVSPYLVTPARGTGQAPGSPGTGSREIAADHSATWYLGAPLDVARLQVPDPTAAEKGTEIGLMMPGGSTRWFPASAVGGSVLALRLAAPVAAVAVTVRAGRHASRLGPPTIVTAGGAAFVADGQLQDALVPPQWGYAGRDGSFAVFADHDARGSLWLAGLGGQSAAGASVRAISGSADEPTAAAVRSRAGVRVIRSVAAIPGWTAIWHPQRGQPMALAVHRAGVVQSVTVPAGDGVVTWSYSPPRFAAGLALSVAALVVVILALALVAGRSRRRTGPLGGQAAKGPARPGPTSRTGAFYSE